MAEAIFVKTAAAGFPQMPAPIRARSAFAQGVKADAHVVSFDGLLFSLTLSKLKLNFYKNHSKQSRFSAEKYNVRNSGRYLHVVEGC